MAMIPTIPMLRLGSRGVVASMLLLAACSSDPVVDLPDTVATTGVVEGPSTTDNATDADLADGDLYSGPDGSYTMTVGASWSELSAPAAGVTAWAVGEGADGFTPNVNALTQDVPGIDLETYLELSLEELSGANLGDFEVIFQGTATAVNGNELAVLEYRGMPAGAPADLDLNFLAIIDVRDGVAVVVTLTAADVDFARIRAEAEPFMRTVAAS